VRHKRLIKRCTDFTGVVGRDHDLSDIPAVRREKLD